MRNEPDNGASIAANIPTTSPELSYSLTFPTAGVYHVWLRTFTGNLAQDSAHVGLDGQVVATADKFSCDDLQRLVVVQHDDGRTGRDGERPERRSAHGERVHA